MKLIVGLGNPGKKYENTRHNVGFIVLDKIADKLGISFKSDTKLKGLIAEYRVNGEKVILLKPSTFMNLSGDSISLVMKYFNIDKEDMIILYDDLDVLNGNFKIKQKGSSAGHNGLKSIISHLGNNVFNRVKIGIGRDSRYKVVDYVLGRFSEEQSAMLNLSSNHIVNLVNDFVINNDILNIMNKYNSIGNNES